MATLVFQTVLSIALNWAVRALMQEGREGPRLQNLKLQTSEYGKMIPIPFGMVRLPGIVEWTTDLEEHKHETGGKGGGGFTSFTYSASFSVKVCEGPVVGVQRIWADQTLIWEAGGTSTDIPEVPVTIYLGEDDQLPDPTMESIIGVGNVSANRGYCYCVFTDWDLGPYGNRIPVLNFEVFTKGGDIPWRVSTFNAWPLGSAPFGYRVHLVATFENGVITTSFTARLGLPGSITYFYVNQFDIYGNQIGSEVVSNCGFNSIDLFEVRNAHLRVIIGPGSMDYSWWELQLNPESPDFLQYRSISGYLPISVSSSPGRLAGNLNILQSEYLYAVDDAAGSPFHTTVYAYNAAGLSPSVGAGEQIFSYELDLHYANSNIAIGSSDTGHIYIMVGARSNCKLWKLDSELNLVKFWPVVETTGTKLQAGNSNFHVWKQYIAYSDRAGPSTWLTSLVKINDDDTLEDYGVELTGGAGFHIDLGHGLGLDQTGVYSLNPPPEPVILGADIVAPITVRCGESRYNVDELPDLVDGFAIIEQGAGRDQLNSLMPAYFFGGVESGGLIVFRKLGRPVTVIIPQDDLAAHVTGSQDPPLVTVKRGQEVDLPARLNVNFLDIAVDYQQNTQYAWRSVTRSQAFITISLAIVMGVAKASQIAWTQLFVLWQEREKFVILLPRKYWMYEPIDIIQVPGYVFRVTAKSDVAAGVIQLEGVATNTNTWVQGPTPASGDGFTTSPPNPLVPSLLLLLDIPLIVDTDADYGLYAASGPNTPVTWGGMTLFRSADGGGTYAQVGFTSTQVVMGTTTDILGVHGGGNTFDVINSVTVTIGAGGGDFESSSMDAVLNGGGFYLVGDEIVQVMTATEVSAGVWTLSGPMLRGRRGTEWAMQFHQIGERVVFFPALNVDGALSDLGLARLYKAVTQGMTLGSANSQTFTNNGAAARPYSPEHVAGGPIDPFDGTVRINWQRRTRKGGAWNNFADVPLSEAIDRDIVQIWNSTYTLCARIITVDNADTTTYSAADQVTDFGAEQMNVYVTVGQVGAYQLGRQTAAIIPGLGASDDDPLNPVTPYNTTPPPTAGGCTLTQINTSITWGTSPYDVFAPGLTASSVWVMSFTTPGSPVGGSNLGNLAAAEYGGPPLPRIMTLSLAPCGAPLGGLTGSQVGGTAPIIWFCMANNPDPANIPTLLPATTYYMSVTSAGSSGMVASLQPPT